MTDNKNFLSRLKDKYFSSEVISQFSKYGAVSVLNYIFLFFGTYVLVEWVKLASSISYFIITTTVYVVSYLIYGRLIFHVDSSRTRATKYLLAIVGFWIFNNALFNALTVIFGIYYLIAVVFNMVFFGILRFFVYRNFVFKD